MDFSEQLREKAKKDAARIIFPESTDERVLKACSVLKKENLVQPILIGDRQDIEKVASSCGADIQGIEIRDPAHDENSERFAEEFFELRKHKGLVMDQAKELLKDNVYFGTMMLHNSMAEGLVSGAVHTTAETLRPALQVIKTKEGVKIASSFFFMLLGEKIYLFADCGFVVDPSDEELADISMSTAESARFFGIEPKVALLSFSTKGSAKHEDAEKVTRAFDIVKRKNPDFAVDGELQLDAAIVPKVAEMKCPSSKLKGDANVLIFPDLGAGNIGYKLVQRLAGAKAIGPIVQGLKKPVNDLSRGCSTEDIVDVALITAIQGQK